MNWDLIMGRIVELKRDIDTMEHDLDTLTNEIIKMKFQSEKED